jgi:gamma-glutamyltranspeptidase/glutathione hydrolase
VKLVAGSPGGPWIAGFVAQLVNLTLGQGVPLEQALAFPHWGSRNGPAELEAGRAPAALRSGLEQLGETVREMELTSGLNAIERVGEHWVGAGDPRREGRAAGR